MQWCWISWYHSEKPKELERVVIVHALATFENSPNANFEHEDVNSLNKYIHSEKHLNDNICQVEVFFQSKWEIAVKMHVVTTRLWEGPRQYVWKHLGASNFWSRGNGTKIRISRIHVKWLFHPLISQVFFSSQIFILLSSGKELLWVVIVGRSVSQSVSQSAGRSVCLW